MEFNNVISSLVEMENNNYPIVEFQIGDIHAAIEYPREFSNNLMGEEDPLAYYLNCILSDTAKKQLKNIKVFNKKGELLCETNDIKTIGSLLEPSKNHKL